LPPASADAGAAAQSANAARTASERPLFIATSFS
jgi:hypothetical protein